MTAARTWNDTYFDKKVPPSDLVAVFDVNYDELKSHFNRILAFSVFFVFLCMASFVADLSSEEQETGSSHSMKTDGSDGSWSLFWVGYIGFILFLLARAVHRQKKNVYGLHVALTSQGIRKDSNHFPFANFFHTSTTVGLGHRHASVRLMLAHSLAHRSIKLNFCLQMPYEEISKVHVHRPWCGTCGRGGVHVVAVADGSPHCILGLEDPDGFVKLVEQMMEEH